MNQPDPSAAPSEEFVIRVNDVIEMANRIGRRFDTAHAQMVLLHAFSRYGAFHYLSTVTQDSEEERSAYADYIGKAVQELLASHIAQMRGAAPAAGEPAAE